jgi:hypothetical protein
MGKSMDDPGAAAPKQFHRELCVRYPPGSGRVVLRTELDWEKSLQPASVSDDGAASTFVLESRRPFLYFKPCLERDDGRLIWSVGSNMLALMTVEVSDAYPYFTGTEKGSFAPLAELDSTILGRRHRLRIYLPAGYAENTLRSYPVFYMQDGRNLFFPEEAFQGRDWQVAESLGLLDAMCAVDRAIVVGIDCGDRMAEYTHPGYEDYARSVVQEIRPELLRRFRILDSPSETGVLGSSLGGVVSFYMAYQHPQDGEVGWNLVPAFGATALRTGLNAASTVGVGPVRGWSVAFFGGLGGYGIAHYLPLDGTVFKDSRSVDSEPFVGFSSIGASVRHGRFALGLAGSFHTDTFETERNSAEYGTLSLSWYF